MLLNLITSVQAPNDPVVEARVVFVTFSDAPKQALPAWRDEFATQFDDYIRTMSGDRQRVNISVITNPNAEGMAWMADHPYSYYDTPSVTYPVLNKEILRKIETVRGGAVWDRVTFVFMMLYKEVIWCTSFCNPPARVNGIALLGCGAGTCADSFPAAIGTTQSFGGDQLDEPGNRESAKWIAAHEYGHSKLLLSHTPGSEGPDNVAKYVNLGHYDQMKAYASYVSEQGFVPYHALQLALDLGPKWLPDRQIITTDTEGLRVPDIRGANPAFFEVRVPGRTDQSFLLVNHQTATDPYDAKYLTSGLYIWHMLDAQPFRMPGTALDLESAEGKYQASGNPKCLTLDFTQPDAVSGKDRLEACQSVSGTSLDGFDGVSRTIMACGTNPSTSLYSGTNYSDPQSVKTSVAFENIRRDGSDMLVDVYVTPRQRLFWPNGGQVLHGTVAVDWTPRPMACITGVDVNVSRNSGATWESLVTGTANDGSWNWYPAAFDTGSHYRIRIVSHDEAGATAADESGADFAITGSGGGSSGGGGCWPIPCIMDLNPSIGPSRLSYRGGHIDLRFGTPNAGRLRLCLFDPQGRRVADRGAVWYPAGYHTVSWRPGPLAAGVYIVRLESDQGWKAQTKLTILR